MTLKVRSVNYCLSELRKDWEEKCQKKHIFTSQKVNRKLVKLLYLKHVTAYT